MLSNENLKVSKVLIFVDPRMHPSLLELSKNIKKEHPVF